jgi:hypothetical protein
MDATADSKHYQIQYSALFRDFFTGRVVQNLFSSTLVIESRIKNTVDKDYAILAVVETGFRGFSLHQLLSYHNHHGYLPFLSFSLSFPCVGQQTELKHIGGFSAPGDLPFFLLILRRFSHIFRGFNFYNFFDVPKVLYFLIFNFVLKKSSLL